MTGAARGGRGRGWPAPAPGRAMGGQRRPGGGPGQRREQGEELGGEQVEGRQAVRELLLAGHRRVFELIVAEGRDPSAVLEEIVDLAGVAGGGGALRPRSATSTPSPATRSTRADEADRQVGKAHHPHQESGSGIEVQLHLSSTGRSSFEDRKRAFVDAHAHIVGQNAGHPADGETDAQIAEQLLDVRRKVQFRFHVGAV